MGRFASLAAVASLKNKEIDCVNCGRPVEYIQPRTAYERLLRARQVSHRLCQRCARITNEVGRELDGLWRKKRFLQY